MTKAAVIAAVIMDSVRIAPRLRHIRKLPRMALGKRPDMPGPFLARISSTILETYRRDLQNLQNPDERARPAQPRSRMCSTSDILIRFVPERGSAPRALMSATGL
jgi:hypothetical protein